MILYLTLGTRRKQALFTTGLSDLIAVGILFPLGAKNYICFLLPLIPVFSYLYQDGE